MGIDWKRTWLMVAGVSGAIAVGFGAYAAHGLENAPAIRDWLEKGSRYQMYHALALLAVAHLQRPQAPFAWLAGCLFTAGTVLFSGGLYALALLSWPVTPIVPFGGVSFILGWLALSLSALRDPGV